MARGSNAAGASKAGRHGTTGPRIMPVTMLASAAAVGALTIVWQHAQNYDTARLAQGASLAQQALHSHGLTWARVSERDGTVNIAGAAPSEAARVLAYHTAKRALRPLMGRDATITGIRSLVVLKPKSELLGRVAVSPPLDIASLTPPPMPLVHEAAVRHAARDASPATDVADITPDPVSTAHDRTSDIETGAVTRMEADTASPGGEVSEAHTGDGSDVADAMPDMGNATQDTTAASVEPETLEASQTPQAADTAATEPVEQKAAAIDTAEEPGREAANVEPVDAQPQPTRIAATEVARDLALEASEPAPPVDACADAFADALDSATINFARGSAAIQKDSRPLLDKLATIAKSCKGYRLTVEGHTDLTGSRAANLSLSKKRAEAVRWALIDRGIDMDHIAAEGFGSTRPLESAITEEANARNRRIAITVSEPESPATRRAAR